MVEVLGRHRAQKGKVIDHRGGVRQKFRNVTPALAMAVEFAPRAKQLGHFFGETTHEGKPFPFHERGRDGLTVQLSQFRFVVEQIQLAGSASHEQENDALCPSREMRFFGCQRVGHLGRGGPQ